MPSAGQSSRIAESKSAATTGRHPLRSKRHVIQRIIDVIWFVAGVGLLIVFCLAPFYWMVVTSLKSPSSIFNNEVWPKQISLENYFAVFSAQNHFGRALINSVIIAGGTTVVAMLAGVLCAYAVTRMRFRGKRYILMAVLAASMFPGVAILTPLYSLFSQIHWIDTYQAMIIPDISLALQLAVWTLSSFYQGIQ